MSNNPLNRLLNPLRRLIFTLLIGVAFGSTTYAQTLLYQWNFDNAVTSGIGGTNITVAPAVVDSADGYIGGNLISIYNTAGTLTVPAGSGVGGNTNSLDLGLYNSLANGGATNAGTPANGGLVGGAGDLSAITNQFTVTTWFKFSPNYYAISQGGNARVFDIDSHTANNGIGSGQADGNELYFDVALGSDALQLGVNNPGPAGAGGNGAVSVANLYGNTTNFATVTNIWFFTALVYTNSGGGTIQVYVGTTNTTAALATTLTGIGVLSSTNTWKNTTNLFLIANRATDGKRNFPGTIDDVRLYQQGLTLAQIQGVQNVFSPPTITQQPVPNVVLPGYSPQFSVTASGSVPFVYQWSRNGTNLIDGGNISGSASNILTISNVSAADVANNYQVVITNRGGTITSTQVSLSLTTTNGAYQAAVLSNSPFAFYTFSETGNPQTGPLEAYDSLGVFNGTYGVGGAADQFGSGALNGANGVAGPQTTANGLIGFPDNNTALGATYQNFPVDAYVSAPPFNLNNGAGTNVLTISAWINPIGGQVHAVGIVFSRSGTTVAGLNYQATNLVDGNMKLGYTWNNDPNTYNWDSGLEPTPGIWSLVSLVITPTNATIYVVNANGLQFSTHSYAHVVQKFEGPTLIGNDVQDATGKRNFEGSIDEVAFFNQALTANQISALYAAASGTVFSPQPPTISVEPAWPSPIYVGQSATASVTSAGGLTYQWKAGLGGVYTNLVDGANIAGSATPALTINSVQPTNALDYIVVIANSFGSITSAPAATLTVTPSGPAQNFTLDLGGTPIVEAGGTDWNTVNNWNPGGQAASVSAFSNPGSTYTVVAGARLRTPVVANSVFPGTGTTLTLNGDGVFEDGGTNPVTIGELRIKHNTFNPATNYYGHLVLNGGEIFNGDTGLLIIQGRVDVQASSVLYSDVAENRSFQIDAWLTGAGNIFYHDANANNNGTADFNVTGSTNTFTGQWVIDQGVLLGSGTNSLGTNNITIGRNGLAAAIETLYDLNSTNASLILDTNGQVFLHQNDHFASVIITNTPLANGLYTASQLSSLYPSNFPASWVKQIGSTFNTASGQIIVGNAPLPPSTPKVTHIGLSGTTLSLSAANGTAGGVWILLQSTNVALPLSQWQTNTAGNFDGGGNLSTNIANTATNLQEFYILKVQ
jgi:hypothetical protein